MNFVKAEENIFFISKPQDFFQNHLHVVNPCKPAKTVKTVERAERLQEGTPIIGVVFLLLHTSSHYVSVPLSQVLLAVNPLLESELRSKNLSLGATWRHSFHLSGIGS